MAVSTEEVFNALKADRQLCSWLRSAKRLHFVENERVTLRVARVWYAVRYASERFQPRRFLTTLIRTPSRIARRCCDGRSGHHWTGLLGMSLDLARRCWCGRRCCRCLSRLRLDDAETGIAARIALATIVDSTAVRSETAWAVALLNALNGDFRPVAFLIGAEGASDSAAVAALKLARIAANGFDSRWRYHYSRVFMRLFYSPHLEFYLIMREVAA